MSGLLSVGADVGQTVSLIRENGQAEPCAVMAPAAPLAAGSRNNSPLAWDAGLAEWRELPVASALSANGMVSNSPTTMVVGNDGGDVQVVAGVGHAFVADADVGSLSGLSGQVAFRWAVLGPAPLLGFYAAAAAPQPTITGSKGGNAALASLLTELATLGLIVDGTT